MALTLAYNKICSIRLKHILAEYSRVLWKQEHLHAKKCIIHGKTCESCFCAWLISFSNFTYKGFKSTGSVCKILSWLRMWKLKEGRMITAMIFVVLLGSWHECKELVWEACLGCIKKKSRESWWEICPCVNRLDEENERWEGAEKSSDCKRKTILSKHAGSSVFFLWLLAGKRCEEFHFSGMNVITLAQQQVKKWSRC